jgi:hypothetical protein
MATTTTTAPAPGLKYTYKDGDSYKDWYLANTGKEWDGAYLTARPEGMSDADWTQGMLMQQFDSSRAAAEATRDQTKAGLGDIYKQQTSAAQQSFNSMANQYGQQMKNELEYAGVLHERMKKYLPQQMAAQGMGNMGVAQTAGANAVAKHVSNRGAIIGQNQAAMNELSRTHGERQAGLDTKYAEGMMAADATYNSTMADLNSGRYEDDLALFGQTVKEKEDEQEQYFLAGSSGIKEAKTREEALALAEQMKPYVSQAQYERLVVEANNRGNVLDGIAGEETDEAYAETKKQFEELIVGAPDAATRAAYLEQYKDKLTPEDYQYYQNSIANLDDLQTKEDAQAGQQKASEQLTSLFAAGASSADIRTTYDQMVTAGTITEADKPYWESMLSTLEKREAEEAEGKVSAEQKEFADFGMALLGDALTPEARAEIMAGMAAQLATGKITQAQYDAAVAYCGVLDGNAEYLKGLEEQDAADAERAQLVDDIIDYVVGVARNYAEAEEYFKEYGGDVEFTEAEKRSIKIALKMRQNMDEDDALYEMNEKQSAAYDQCVTMLGLCKTTAKQLETLETFKEKLAPEVYEELKMVLDIQAKDPDVQAAEKEQEREDNAKDKGYGSAAEYDAAVIEGKEPIVYEGSKYFINGTPADVDEQAIKEALNAGNAKNPTGEVTADSIMQGFENWVNSGYSSVEPSKEIENGRVVAIYDRKVTAPQIGGRPSGREEVQPPREVVQSWAVYYNGAWYPCFKVYTNGMK